MAPESIGEQPQGDLSGPLVSDEDWDFTRSAVSDASMIGDLSAEALSGIAAEALARGDVDIFTHVTQHMQQSGDPEAERRAGQLLETYAAMAAGDGRKLSFDPTA